jgi:putative transposase
LKNQYDINIAPSTYYEAKKRPISQKEKINNFFIPLIQDIYDKNYKVYGIDKIWNVLKNQGHDISRSRVYRIMKQLNISGAIRGKRIKTTIQNKSSKLPEDLVNRNFNSNAPNRLWVADFTYVHTEEDEWVYVAFIVDVFSRGIVAHYVSKVMDHNLVQTAFNIALFNRQKQGFTNFKDLIHHSDKGSQYTSYDFQALLYEYKIRPSVGGVGDSYDNALAETINGIYKTELIKKQKCWIRFKDVRDASAKWVNWYNNERVNKHCNWLSPVEFEEKFREENS